MCLASDFECKESSPITCISYVYVDIVGIQTDEIWSGDNHQPYISASLIIKIILTNTVGATNTNHPSVNKFISFS